MSDTKSSNFLQVVGEQPKTSDAEFVITSTPDATIRHIPASIDIFVDNKWIDNTSLFGYKFFKLTHFPKTIKGWVNLAWGLDVFLWKIPLFKTAVLLSWIF